jgi:hypothetical protein
LTHQPPPNESIVPETDALVTGENTIPDPLNERQSCKPKLASLKNHARPQEGGSIRKRSGTVDVADTTFLKVFDTTFAKAVRRLNAL